MANRWSKTPVRRTTSNLGLAKDKRANLWNIEARDMVAGKVPTAAPRHTTEIFAKGETRVARKANTRVTGPRPWMTTVVDRNTGARTLRYDAN